MDAEVKPRRLAYVRHEQVERVLEDMIRQGMIEPIPDTDEYRITDHGRWLAKEHMEKTDDAD